MYAILLSLSIVDEKSEFDILNFIIGLQCYLVPLKLSGEKMVGWRLDVGSASCFLTKGNVVLIGYQMRRVIWTYMRY